MFELLDCTSKVIPLPVHYLSNVDDLPLTISDVCHVRMHAYIPTYIHPYMHAPCIHDAHLYMHMYVYSDEGFLHHSADA